METIRKTNRKNLRIFIAMECVMLSVIETIINIKSRAKLKARNFATSPIRKLTENIPKENSIQKSSFNPINISSNYVKNTKEV